MNLFVETIGSGEPTLVLLHGLGVNGATFKPLVRVLKWPGRVIVPDLRGHGRSPHAKHYGLAHFAADIADLLDPNARVQVVGHSMGGGVGLVLASGFFGVAVERVTAFGVRMKWTAEDLSKGAAFADSPVRWFDTREAAVERFLRVAGAPFIGPGILLLPGIAVAGAVAVRRRRWASLSPILWALLYLGIYAARLPVTYQHGRYQIPVLLVVVVLGWEGIYLATMQARRSPARLLVRAWAAAVVAATLAFVVLGARAYAQDVAVIESEMVDAARWISTHTEADDLIAAHDIGALGYFGGRRVLDLAGLADADVIPMLRNEAALADLLDQRGADYLMTFPSWYPALTACANLVQASDGRFSPQQGGENMRIYRWPSPPVARPESCMLYSP